MPLQAAEHLERPFYTDYAARIAERNDILRLLSNGQAYDCGSQTKFKLQVATSIRFVAKA